MAAHTAECENAYKWLRCQRETALYIPEIAWYVCREHAAAVLREFYDAIGREYRRDADDDTLFESAVQLRYVQIVGTAPTSADIAEMERRQDMARQAERHQREQESVADGYPYYAPYRSPTAVVCGRYGCCHGRNRGLPRDVRR